MDGATFICHGDNRETLLSFKNALCDGGNAFIGYLRDPATLLRYVRHHMPDLLVLDVERRFDVIREAIEKIDSELLCACVLVVPKRSSELTGFLKRSRSVSVLVEPADADTLRQIADNALLHHRRMLDMAARLRDLNEKMEARQIIEKAKWTLVSREKMTEEDAYECIRKRSRDRRVPMKDVAEAILIAFG